MVLNAFTMVGILLLLSDILGPLFTPRMLLSALANAGSRWQTGPQILIDVFRGRHAVQEPQELANSYRLAEKFALLENSTESMR